MIGGGYTVAGGVPTAFTVRGFTVPAPPMSWQYTPYTLPLLLTAILMAVLGALSWGRKAAGARAVAILAVAAAGWATAYALELGSLAFSTKVFWAKAQYLGIVVLPVAWLLIAAQYTGRMHHLQARTLMLLGCVPILTVLLAFTNELHGWIWSNVALVDTGAFITLALTHGPAFWINWVFANVLLLSGTVLLAGAWRGSARYYRRQIGFLLLAASFPWLANLLYVSRLSPFPFLDLTPFAFALTGLFSAWALFRYGLLDVWPLARERILAQMDDGLIVCNEQGQVLQTNASALRLLDLTDKHIIGQPAAQVLPVELITLLKQVSDATATADEIGIANSSGRFLEVSVSPLVGDKNQTLGSLMLLHDVSKRKQAEEEVKRNTTLLLDLSAQFLGEVDEARVLDHALAATLLAVKPDRCGILLLDAGVAGPILAAGRGYPEELSGQARLRLDEPWIEEVITTRQTRVIADVPKAGNPLGAETEGRDDGSGYNEIAATIAAPLVVAEPGHRTELDSRNHQALGILLTQWRQPQDLTEAQVQLVTVIANSTAQALERARLFANTERNASERAALYETVVAINASQSLTTLLPAIVERAVRLLDTHSGGLFLVRPDGQSLELVVAHNLPGGSPGTILQFGEGLTGRVAQSGRPDMVSDYRNWALKAPRYQESMLRRMLAVPLIHHGRVIGVLDIADDKLTGDFSENDVRLAQLFANQAAIAAENARLLEHTRQQATDLDRRNRELEDAAAIREQLLRNVSHELRTPITIIHGYSEMMIGQSEGEGGNQHYLGEILEQTRRLEHLVDNVLTGNEIEQRPLSLETIVVADWLRNVLAHWQPVLHARNLELHAELGTDLGVVLGDRQLLIQVVDNLLSNAIKFSPRGGAVEVRAWQQRNTVNVTVADAGIGAEPDDLPYVFDRFYQADAGASRQFSGLGLGLWVARAIVHRHGGQICADSAGKDQGMEVTFTLPLAAGV